MGEQEDPLVSVHDVLGFLSDFDSLSDPMCCPVVAETSLILGKYCGCFVVLIVTVMFIFNR